MASSLFLFSCKWPSCTTCANNISYILSLWGECWALDWVLTGSVGIKVVITLGYDVHAFSVVTEIWFLFIQNVTFLCKSFSAVESHCLFDWWYCQSRETTPDHTRHFILLDETVRLCNVRNPAEFYEHLRLHTSKRETALWVETI